MGRIIRPLCCALVLVAGCANGRADAAPGEPIRAPAALGNDAPHLWREAAASSPAVAVPGQISLAALLKQLKPAVVNISSTTVVKNPHRNLPRTPGQDDDEQQLFERFFGQREVPDEMKGTSLGSGFIINAEGLVLTNNHVVKDATDIKVRLADGREFVAKTLGRDPGTDVALLQLQKVDGRLPTVPLGDSDALEQGEFVLAIGSPLGFRESATFGIVSAKDRQLTGSPFDDFLQTDAAINQGNSGGPLFNMRGEVVGINTAIISPQIGSGIGFAVPINLAKELLPQLATGKVSRGFLGVTVSELTPDLAQGFGMKPGTKGALVQAVMPKSPAAQGGLQPGDVVVAVNGKAVESSGQLTRTIASVTPGGKASLTVLRGSDWKNIEVTVGQRPDEEALARGEANPDGDDDQGQQKSANEKLGLRVAPLTPQAVKELGLASDEGVLVVRVTPDGPAGAAGLRRNDVILEVNRQQITSVDQLRGLISKMKPGQVAVLRVARGQQAQYVAVKLGGEKP